MAQMSSYKNANDALAPSKAKAYVEGARILATGPDGDGNEINLNIPIDDLRGNKTTNWNDIEGKPEFANVATTGSYNDLSDKPEQPVLAEVATSGSYNDLKDKPNIPAAQVQADWDQESSSAPDFIKNKPNMDEYVKGEDLSTVASTGDYDDLINAPKGVKINGANKQFNSETGYADLGTVLTEHQDVSGKAEKSEMAVANVSGDATKKKVTLKQGLSVDVVTAHQDISGKANDADLARVAKSGNYNDLQNTPTIPNPQIQSDWDQSDETAKDFIKNKPSIPPAQVQADWNASSGMAVILNKPSIPAEQIQADWNQSDSTAKDFIKNKPSIPPAQVQADWNQSVETAKDFIRNKPANLGAGIKAGEKIKFTTDSDGFTVINYDPGSGS